MYAASTAIYCLPAIAIYFVMRWVFFNQYLYMLLKLGGTIAHELCHFVVGFLLGAKPVGFSLIPHRADNNKWTLGSVSFGNIRWYNGVFVGMAPLLILAPFYFLIPSHFALGDFKSPGCKDCITWLAMAYFLPSAVPSGQDFKVAIVSALPVVVFCTLGYLLYKY